jgi:hypothetical protein
MSSKEVLKAEILIVVLLIINLILKFNYYRFRKMLVDTIVDYSIRLFNPRKREVLMKEIGCCRRHSYTQ